MPLYMSMSGVKSCSNKLATTCCRGKGVELVETRRVLDIVFAEYFAFFQVPTLATSTKQDIMIETLSAENASAHEALVGVFSTKLSSFLSFFLTSFLDNVILLSIAYTCCDQTRMLVCQPRRQHCGGSIMDTTNSRLWNKNRYGRSTRNRLSFRNPYIFFISPNSKL